MSAKKGSDSTELRDTYVAKITAEGYVQSFPEPCELQVDIDNEEHLAVFAQQVELLEREIHHRYGCPVPRVETPSKSGLPARHVRLMLPFELSDWQRIAWQAALGSDPVRELLNCFRVLDRVPNPCMLIERTK